MCETIGERRAALENERLELGARKAAIAARSLAAVGGKKPKKKLKLNVGGSLVTVLRSTLTSKPRTRLAALFSGIYDGQLRRDRKGRIFLDLNPECFREIVDWLAHCELAGPDDVKPHPAVPPGHADTMEHMMRFFGLDSPRPAAEAPAEEGDPPVPDQADPEPEPEAEDDLEAWETHPVEDAAAVLLAAMRAERVTLRAAIDEHQRMVEEFEDEEAWIGYFTGADAPGQAPELVDLDVGGTPVTVKRSTLLLCSESGLAERFSAEGWVQQQADEDSDDSEEDDDAGVFIKESSYSFRKIIDQLRLRAISPEGTLPPPPTIAQDKQGEFRTVLAHYFGGVENFILTAPKPELQGYTDQAPTYLKDTPIEPNAPQGVLAIGEAGLRFEADGLPAGLGRTCPFHRCSESPSSRLGLQPN
jgi:hypothetical protein